MKARTWEETVIKKIPEVPMSLERVRRDRLAQAEVSFKTGEEQGYVRGFDAAESTMIPRATKDGRQAGIREVVEWLEKHTETGEHIICHHYIDWEGLQAQKKEWGKKIVRRGEAKSDPKRCQDQP